MELTACEIFIPGHDCFTESMAQDDVCNFCQNDDRFTPEDYNRVR